MREKFIPDFNDCLSKTGIDERLFIEVLKYVVQEYKKRALIGRAEEDSVDEEK